MFVMLAAMAFILAAVPAWLWHRNLRLYAPPPPPTGAGDVPGVSLLIPARNEEQAIRAALEAALRSQDVDLEMIVLDDHSSDATAVIVREIAAHNQRLRLVPAPPLPAGWCGKQHACAVLASLASHPLLVFMDADVRLAPDGVARLAAFLHSSRADLVSGLPRQEFGSPAERLLLPLIHFLLLGFLPLRRMRRRRHPAYGAGCGQLFMARRQAYEQAGGHAAIRTSLHDGLTLPRAFRQAGLMTDLCDATTVASCRMYHNASEVWHGLAKNATEGLAAPRVILPATLLLLGGHLLPVVLLALAVFQTQPPSGVGLAALALLASYYPRIGAVRRFGHPWGAALWHPLSIAVLVLIQWYACLRAVCGRPAVWKGRRYPAVGMRH